MVSYLAISSGFFARFPIAVTLKLFMPVLLDVPGVVPVEVDGSLGSSAPTRETESMVLLQKVARCFVDESPLWSTQGPRTRRGAATDSHSGILCALLYAEPDPCPA